MTLAWRPLLRELGAYLLVGLSLGLLVLLAWWTRHPDAASLSVVREWPVVGTLAGRLQDLYLPGGGARTEDGDARLGPVGPAGTSPSASEGTAKAEMGNAGTGGEPSEPLVELKLVYELREPRPYVWVSEGIVLRREPSFDSEALLETEATTNLYVEERRGDWARVRHRGVEAWVMKPRRRSGESHGNRPSRVLPIPGHGPDRAVVERALGAMSGGTREFELGPYGGHTDAEVDSLVAHCRPLVADLEATYAAATGLRPLGSAEETLFVFADRAEYEAFYSGARRSETGHAGNGYAALSVGERRIEDVCATLVHETIHLLNRRAIGPALPPWLDEGLASHLRSLVAGERAEVVEAAATWAAGTLPSLRILMDLDTEDYHAGVRESLHYELSALWIEYLLADPELAGRFRGFLAYLAGGGPWSNGPFQEGFEAARRSPELGDDLLVFLDRDYPALDAGFRVWLWSRAP